MRIGIHYKLFLTLLVTALCVTIGMAIFVKWSSDRGFLRYVNTRELNQLQPLLDALKNEYATQGSWQQLTNDQRYWRQLLRRELDAIYGRHPPGPGKRSERHKFSQPPLQPPISDTPNNFSIQRRPGPPGNIHRRIALLDANLSVLLLGDRAATGTIDPSALLTRKIELDGQTVGYLALAQRREFLQSNELRFLQDQTLFLLYIACAAIVIAAGISLPAARSLVLPIRKLHHTTRQLVSGKYGETINIDRNDEIGELARDFNSLSRTLAKNQKSRQQWVADIAHELRTPLSVLQGETEAMLDGIRSVERKNICSLHKELMRINLLVDDLYQLSLADLGALNYKKSTVDILPILLQCLEVVQSRLDQQGLVLTLNTPSTPVLLSADAARLCQLFGNLLENTLRYTDSPGQLTIDVLDSSNCVTIDFYDSSPGVTLVDQAKLFERLYRVESSRNRATGGAGLGLSICQSIVVAHNGAMTALDSPLGGLKIHIVFNRHNTL